MLTIIDNTISIIDNMKFLLRTAAYVCLGLEVLCAIGALSFIPAGLSMPSTIAANRASAILAVHDGGPSFKIHFHRLHATYDAGADGIPLDGPMGSLSFGPFRLPNSAPQPA